MADRSRASRSNPFSQRSHERIVSVPGSLQGADISLDTLQACEVFILDYTAAVYVDECSDCHIRIGPVSTFCYFRNCNDCKVSVACQQFRAKDCRNLTVFLFSASDPHIELCTEVHLGPYNFAYPLQDTHFKKAGLNPGVNKWSQVYDHTPSGNREERHWTIMEPEEYEPIVYQIEDLGKPTDPVAKPSMYAKNGVKGEILVGSQVYSKGKDRKEKKDISPPSADIIIEDPSGEVSNHDVPTPRADLEAPGRNVWGAPNIPSQVSDEEEYPVENEDAWVDPGQANSQRFSRSSKSAKMPLAEFSPFENPILTSPSPRSAIGDTSEVRLHYTRWVEFRYPAIVPGLRAPPAYLHKTLQKASDTAHAYHEQIRMYAISAFCVLFTGLLLLLVIVLLYDFIGMYDEGLEFQLVLLGVVVLALLVYVVVRLVGAVKRGNQECHKLLVQESADKYKSSGLELTGDLYTLRIVVRSGDTLST